MRLLLVTARSAVDGADTGRTRTLELARALEDYGVECSPVEASTVDDVVAMAQGWKAGMVFCVPSHLPNAEGGRRCVHAVLDAERIPYVGSGADVIEMALSKPAMKARWRGLGITTPDWYVFRKGGGAVSVGGSATTDDGPEFDDIAFGDGRAWMVKPTAEGNSRGITRDSVVRSTDALRARVSSLLESFDAVMVERFLGTASPSREFTAAMVGSGARRLVMPLAIGFTDGRRLRVVTSGDKDGHRTALSPIEPSTLADHVRDFTRQALDAAGVRDYARVDIMEEDGTLYAIEVNGQPMVPDRWFEACARPFGLGGSGYLAAIVLAAALRYDAAGATPLLVDARLRAAVPPAVLAELDPGCSS